MIIAARDHDLAVPVDPGRQGAHQQRRLVGPERLVGDPVRLVDLTLHQRLGQRRSLVRAMHLVTDQGELARVPLLAQGDGGGSAGERCSDDDDAGRLRDSES